MKTALLLLSFLSSAQLSFAAPRPHRHLGFEAEKPLEQVQTRFAYASQDGDFQLPCVTETRDPVLNDWHVTCGKGTPNERRFIAHVVIHRYIRSQAPVMTAYEVLYSVMDESAPEPTRFTSQYTWIAVKGDAPLVETRVTQSVENDYAGLELAVTVR